VGELVAVHALRHLPEGSGDLAEAREMIERFANSPRSRALSLAQEDHAEVEFLLAWPPDGDVPRETIIRGYLDRLYQDTEGRWHVIDFKTNRMSDGRLAELAAKYEMQLLVYALATERILGSAPASLTLHFLRSGEEFAFAWDDDARRRVVAMVNQGILATQGPVAAGA